MIAVVLSLYVSTEVHVMIHTWGGGGGEGGVFGVVNLVLFLYRGR